jgi:ketosteroid isomerase-like protein
MYTRFFKLLLITTIFIFSNGYASTSEDSANFQALFNSWTRAFNQKKFPEVCLLFSKSVTADYQGSPKKNYAMMCNNFRKLFQEKDMAYHNAFKIHQVYRSKDLAAVRITWYLDIYKKGVHISSIQEEGLDVLQKQANDKWQIVNFIAFPVTNK